MSQITCEDFTESITAYLDGVLEPRLGLQFSDHLTECDGCVSFLDQFRRTIRYLGEMPSMFTIPDEVRRSLLHAFRGEAH